MTTEPNDLPDTLLGIPLIPGTGEPGTYLDARPLQAYLASLFQSLPMTTQPLASVEDEPGAFRRDVLSPTFQPVTFHPSPLVLLTPAAMGVVESEAEPGPRVDGQGKPIGEIA